MKNNDKREREWQIKAQRESADVFGAKIQSKYNDIYIIYIHIWAHIFYHDLQETPTKIWLSVTIVYIPKNLIGHI